MNGRARAQAAPDETAIDDIQDSDVEVTERDADLLVDAVVDAADGLALADPELTEVDLAEYTLTDRELQILAFERQWWRQAGAKEQAIRDTFDLSTTRYYQVLNGLLENPAALAQDPMLVRRLRRLRQSRRRTGR